MRGSIIEWNRMGAKQHLVIGNIQFRTLFSINCHGTKLCEVVRSGLREAKEFRSDQLHDDEGES